MGLKSIEYTFCKNGQFEIFQRVISEHLPNPCLKSTIYTLLREWLSTNKLSLNIAKKKYILFHTIKRNVIYPILKVYESNIERVTQFIFLGVKLHSHVTWNKHINHISMKIARSIGILYRLRNVYPESVLITIYNTSSFPLLSLTVGVCCQRKPLCRWHNYMKGDRKF